MQIIKYSINCYINKQIAKIKQQQVKKTRWFNCKENIQDGLQNIPSNLISNLTGKSHREIVYRNTEIEILKYGLKHDIATRRSEVEMIN